MPVSRQTASGIVLAGVLVGVILEGVVLFAVVDPAIRLALGLVVLVPLMWLLVWGTQQGLVEEPIRSPLHKRRYLKLRSKVKQMIDEITRLHWTVVDAKRGIRNRDEVMQEADAIERRLHDMIGEVRRSAGHISPNDEWE
jgi:hypothetical protein